MLRLLLLSQLRFFVRSRLSAVTVLLGITLGVAAVVAVHLISERIAAQLDQGIPSHLQAVTFTARPAPTAETGSSSASAYFELRQRWRAGRVPGVIGVFPVVEGSMPVSNSSSDEQLVTLVGLDWLQMLSVPAMASALMPNMSGGPSAPSAIEGNAANAISVVAQASAGFERGQLLRIGRYRAVVSAVLGSANSAGGADSLGSTPRLYLDIGDAQRVLQMPSSQISWVAIQTQDTQQRLRGWLAALMPGIEAGLPSAVAPALADERSGKWIVQSANEQMPQVGFGRSVLFNLGALGSLSLVVAWFLIYQTAVLWLRRQQRVYVRLLQQGVSPLVLGVVFCTAVVLVGLVAGTVGLGVGVGFAQWLLALMSLAPAADGVEPLARVWPLTASSPVVLKALVSALLVSGVAALVAFRRAAPSLSTGSAVSSGNTTVTRLLYDLFVRAMLVAGVLWGAFGDSGLLGGFVAIAALCLFVLLLLLPMLQRLRGVLSTLRGPLLIKMGVRELAWYPADIAVALGALVLAVATSIGVGTMVESFRLDFSRMLDQRLAADVQVRGSAYRLRELQERLGQDPAVASVRGIYTQPITLAGLPVQMSVTTLDTAGAARYGVDHPVPPSQVLVNEQLARQLSLTPGAKLELLDRRVEVAGIYPGYGDTQGQLVAATAGQWAVTPERAQLQINVATPALLVDQLRQQYPNLQVELRSSIRALALRVFDETFAITRALTITALVVAAVGLYNSLVALSLMQQRSWHLLQIMGVSDWQRLGFAQARSVLVFLLTSVLAVPLGIGMGWLLCQVINPRAFGWSVPLVLSSSAILLPLLMCLAAALVAGLFSLPLMRSTGKAGGSAVVDE